MRVFALISLLLAIAVAGCGSERAGDADAAAAAGDETTAQSDLSGRIESDGSSTVGPFTTAAAERFQRENPGVQVTVGVSGTGGGFERFCAGETDLSNASRAIKDEEQEVCEKNGVEYVEFQVANDALTVVVNPQNDWATCLTTDQLKTIWDRGSKVTNWNEVDPQFPDQSMKLYGPGTDSGTFDYFTDEINGEEGRSRSDYSASEDDNVLVQGVSGDRGAIGYFGLSYYVENEGKLKAVEIDGGEGCVAPSVESAQSGDYTPLSRPLFVYAKKESFARPEVAAFFRFVFENSAEIAQAAKYVPLTDEQLATEQAEFEEATG